MQRDTLCLAREVQRRLPDQQQGFLSQAAWQVLNHWRLPNHVQQAVLVFVQMLQAHPGPSYPKRKVHPGYQFVADIYSVAQE